MKNKQKKSTTLWSLMKPLDLCQLPSFMERKARSVAFVHSTWSLWPVQACGAPPYLICGYNNRYECIGGSGLAVVVEQKSFLIMKSNAYRFPNFKKKKMCVEI